jgi:hypothetical protein
MRTASRAFFLLDLSFQSAFMNSSGLTFRVSLPTEGHCHLRVRILGHCHQNSGTLSFGSDVTFYQMTGISPWLAPPSLMRNFVGTAAQRFQ